MAKNCSRRVASSFFESLESRQLLSHTVFATRLQLFATLDSGLLGQQLSIPATAKLTAAGLPLRTATILFIEDGTVVGQAQTGRSGYASVNLNMLFLGKHYLQAGFAGAERYKQTGSGIDSATITFPDLASFPDGVEENAVTHGTGAELGAGGAFTADYAGFLASNGELFDSSIDDGSPLQSHDDSQPGDVIPGFAEAINGIKVGETRVMYIPAAEGYGANPPSGGSIPKNADLVFVVHLDALG